MDIRPKAKAKDGRFCFWSDVTENSKNKKTAVGEANRHV
jgi:hypothetical protein